MDWVPSEEDCRRTFEWIRWKGEITCSHCNHDKVYIMKPHKLYKCAKCRREFSLFHNTIFKHSKITFRQWIKAIQIMAEAGKGISSYKMAEQIGTTQPNALYVQRRIRKAMHNNPEFRRQMQGIVEIDETFVGGRNKNRHWDKKVKGTQGKGSMKDKSSIVGFIERGTGFVRLFHFRKFIQNGIQGVVKSVVRKGDMIATDEEHLYTGLDSHFTHGTCNHGAYKYVVDDAHTNSIEGFWSEMKKKIIGIHHNVPRKKYVLSYCREVAFRHNTREMRNSDRFQMLLGQFLLAEMG